MTQKNAAPTKEYAQTIAKRGLNLLSWAAVKDLRSRLIIKNRLTGAFKVIRK